MDLIKIKNINEIKTYKNKYNKFYFLAGGTDLMVQYKEELLDNNALIIDISTLKDLNYIKEMKDSIHIGALTPFTDIINNRLINKYAQALLQSAKTIGSLQIRNRATIGGNIANASPAGDSIPALFIHNALIKTNHNKYPIIQIFKGVKKTILKKDEIILKIIIPKNRNKTTYSFYKSGPREALAISKASLATALSRSNNKITKIKIAAGAVGITVLQTHRTEKLLIGKEITPDLIDKAKQMIIKDVAPITDFRSTKLYRENFIMQALEQSLKK